MSFSPAVGQQLGKSDSDEIHLQDCPLQLPDIILPGNNLGQVVYTHASVSTQYNLVPVKGQ